MSTRSTPGSAGSHRTGRRPRWVPSVAVVGACAVLLSLGAVGTGAADEPTPPTRCEVSKLAVPDTAKGSSVDAGDPSGRYLVGWFDTGAGVDSSRLLFWDDGAYELPELPGDYQRFTAVNESGLAVGFSYQPDPADDPRPEPWVYQDGKVSRLPGTDRGQALAVNARGDIAGLDDFKPVRWKADTGELERLELPADADDLLTVGIADDGTVVGIGLGDDDRIFAWRPDGSRFQLKGPDGALQLLHLTVSGTKVAAHVREADRVWSVLWDLSAPEEPRLLSEEIWGPGAVNRHGWIVGDTDITGTFGVGFAAGPDEYLVLQGLTGTSKLGDAAKALSDDGSRIAGTTPDQNDANWAVQWNCS